MNGGVPDDVGSDETLGLFRPPDNEVQHLIVLVQVADSLKEQDEREAGAV